MTEYFGSLEEILLYRCFDETASRYFGFLKDPTYPKILRVVTPIMGPAYIVLETIQRWWDLKTGYQTIEPQHGVPMPHEVWLRHNWR